MITTLQPQLTDIYIDQGTDFIKVFSLKTITDTVFDLTGMEVSVIMKRYTGSDTTFSMIAEVLSAANGTVSISMSATDSADLKYGMYVYTVYVSDGSSLIKAVSGQVLVSNI